MWFPSILEIPLGFGVKNSASINNAMAGIRSGLGMDSQQQQYCLKWNSFGSNLATSFANLWNSESLADVTLYCEGRQFKAHKVILAACSKHFQELFDTAPPSHAGACYVILEATSADNMQALLEFMYKGEVKGLSMEMSQDAWVKQQTQASNERHQARIKTSPTSGTATCEAQEGPQTHTATFAPILPQQSSSSSHCGSVADEPDTRSSPGASARYEENPDSSMPNAIKNNGYDRSASANEEMGDRLNNEQGAEDLRIKSEIEYTGYNNSPPPPVPIPTSNYHEKPHETSP
ncbi:unnamed protein product, partial [Leptidea sinapis]